MKIDDKITKKNILPFIRIVKNSFYISNAYYDRRFSIIRILISYNPYYKYILFLADKRMKELNFSFITYDKCIKSERNFKLKYGNIIIKSKDIHDILYLNYGKKSISLKVNHINNLSNNFSITWCLTSLRNHYDAIVQFNETINLSLKYKVSRIIIYYSDVSERIRYLIKMFEKQGFVKSYYFEENIESCDMKICGKLLQLNDCFYKSIYNSDYLLNVDIDEIIIPRIHKNYLSLLRWCKITYPNSNMFIFYTKLCIKSTDVYHEERRNPNDYFKLPEVKDRSIFSIKNCCTISVIKTACSKYIIKPTMIEALWLHDIWGGKYNYSILSDIIAYTRHTRHLSYGLKRVCFNYTYIQLLY